MGATVNLTHHFLIAMPSMADPNFAHTLTFVCEHNPDGALGLVVNRPIEMTLSALFEQIDVPLENGGLRDTHVLFGGPVSLGYAGWDAGQLEEELAANAWLTVAADPGVMFELTPEHRLPAAMRLLGIDLSQLSEDVGHA